MTPEMALTLDTLAVYQVKTFSGQRFFVKPNILVTKTTIGRSPRETITLLECRRYRKKQGVWMLAARQSKILLDLRFIRQIKPLFRLVPDEKWLVKA